MDNEPVKPDAFEQDSQALADLALVQSLEERPAAPVEVPEIQIDTPQIAPSHGPLPVAEVQAIPDAMAELSEVMKGELHPPSEVQINARQRANERKLRLGKPPIIDHNQAFAELGRVSFESNPVDAYGPEPITADPADVDDMAFPHKQQSAELSSAFRGYLEEDRRWRNTLTEFIKTLSNEVAQHRLELDQLRGHLERSRLS
jgi:hypothetical protein